MGNVAVPFLLLALVQALPPPPSCPPGTFVKGSTCIPCTAGHYCLNGQEIECPAGSYGSSTSSASPTCDGPCYTGFYCSKGSISPRQMFCGDPELWYCPEGTTTGRIQIPLGSYSNPNKINADGLIEGMVDCSPGHYCVKGRQMPCPAGRWGASTGLFTSECDGPCSPGHWCGVGEISSTAHACATAARDVDDFNNDNHYINGGATIQYMSIAPATNYICKEGSDTYATVHSGYYSMPEDGPANTRAHELRCGPGYWCVNGTRIQCSSGYYGNKYGEIKDTCTAICPEGYYCPSGTIIPIACGKVDQYCPLGSFEPLQVTTGYHTYRQDYGIPKLIAVRTNYTNDDVLKTGQGTNQKVRGYVPGEFIVVQEPDKTQNIRSHQTICTKGYYCVGGVRHLCPAGYYGDKNGETNAKCTNVSQAGYFAPPGSTTTQPYVCGAPNYYCPTGSPTPIPVSDGHYTFAPGVEIRNTKTECDASQEWVWQWRRKWTGGQPGQSHENMLQPNGTACQIYPYRALYFPLHNDGYECTGNTCHELVRTTQIVCPKGYYCRFGRLYEIPPGRYGNKQSVVDPMGQGTGVCQEGYYCPPASTEATQWRCGNGGTDGDNSSVLAATFYCPSGSGDPTPTDVGYYTSIGTLQSSELTLVEKRQWWNLPGVSKDPRKPWSCTPPHRKSVGHVSEEGSNQDECHGTAPPNAFQDPPSGRNYDEGIKYEQILCEEGYFCVEGRRNACPRGRYGKEKGMTANLCSGNCAPGYICPAGSFSDKQVPCGTGRENPSAYYCPGYGTTGSWLPVKVDAGYYTIGGDNQYNHTRYAQKICPLGHFCQHGKRYRCPGGTYGNTTGLSTNLCSGKCPGGYFCRPATVEALETGPNPIDVLARDAHMESLNNLGMLETTFLLTSSMNHSHLRPFECGSIYGVRGPCYPTTTGTTALELSTGDRRCELEVTFG